jgi:2-(1,2-epoxy-1,2-dihydrophenyl)acetyl-CoA isomerase
MSTVELSIESSIALIELNRPEQLNSFNVEMIETLMARIDEALERRAEVIVLTGRGRAFCAGADLGDAVGHKGEDGQLDIGRPMRSHFNVLMVKLRHLPVPLVCAVNGPAVGGGFSLAVCGDVVVAAASAYFQQPFAKIGLVPDMGASWLTPRLMGRARALGSAFLCERITADQAKDWGLIWAACEDQTLQYEALGLAKKLQQYSPQALVETRALIDGAYLSTWEEQLEKEAGIQAEMGRMERFINAVRAFLGQTES